MKRLTLIILALCLVASLLDGQTRTRRRTQTTAASVPITFNVVDSVYGGNTAQTYSKDITVAAGTKKWAFYCCGTYDNSPDSVKNTTTGNKLRAVAGMTGRDFYIRETIYADSTVQEGSNTYVAYFWENSYNAAVIIVLNGVGSIGTSQYDSSAVSGTASNTISASAGEWVVSGISGDGAAIAYSVSSPVVLRGKQTYVCGLTTPGPVSSVSATVAITGNDWWMSSVVVKP